MKVLVLLLLISAGCAATRPAVEPTPGSGPPVVALPACGVDPAACLADDECTVSSTTCCTCAMGGDELPVRKACEASLPGRQNCADVMCAAQYRCTGATAKCVEGRCTLAGGAPPPADAPM